MSASPGPEQPLQIAPLSAGFADKVRPRLNAPNEFSESQNITHQGNSARVRRGVIPYTRQRANGSRLQLRDDKGPLGFFSGPGNTLWNSFLMIPAWRHLAVGINTRAWTVELVTVLDLRRVGPNATTTEHYQLFVKNSVNANGTPPIQIEILEESHVVVADRGKMRVTHHDTAGTMDTFLSTNLFPLSSPRMVSLVRDGNDLNLYWDGVLEGTVTLTIGANSTGFSQGAFQIGSAVSSTTLAATGSIDFGFFGSVSEVRIWDTTRSLANIQANIRRQIALDDPNIGNLIGYWPMNEGTNVAIEDESGHGATMYLGPHPPQRVDLGIAQKSAYFFDGHASMIFIETGNASWDEEWAFNLATVLVDDINFTIEVGWTPAKWSDLTSAGTNGFDTICDIRNAALIQIQGDGIVRASFYNGVGVLAPDLVLQSTTVLQPGQRYMISARRQGPSAGNNCFLYINGVQEATGSTTGSVTLNLPFSPRLGCFFDGNRNTNHAMGWMDEFRLWGKQVSPTSILANHARQLRENSNFNGDGVDGQFYTFTFPNVAGTDSVNPTFIDSISTGFFGNIGFNADIRNSFVIFPNEEETFAGTPPFDKPVSIRHVEDPISVSRIDLDNAWPGNHSRSDEIGIKATKLLIWIDCSVDINDQEIAPIPGRGVQSSVGVPSLFLGLRNRSLDLDSRKFGLTFNIAAALSEFVTAAGNVSLKDMVPSFREGFFPPVEQPITGITQWKKPSQGNRFFIAGAGRSLFWVFDRWSRNRPYVPEKDVDGYSLHFLEDDIVRIPYNNTVNQGLDFQTTFSFEFWINPHRVDNPDTGQTILFSKGGTNVGPTLTVEEIRIALDQAKIVVSWTRDAGVNGLVVSTFSSVVRKDKWQHIAVSVQKSPTSVFIYLDGIRVPSVTVSSTGAVDDVTTDDLTIGGNQIITDLLGQRIQFYFGFMDDVRISDNVRYNSLDQFQVPSSAQAVDSNSLVVMRFDDARDVFVEDISAHAIKTAQSHGQLEYKAWLPLKSDLLPSSVNAPYHFRVFRNRLFATNGENFPLRVDHSGSFGDLDEFGEKTFGFTTTRMGIVAPPSPAEVVNVIAGGGGIFAQNEKFVFYYTYYNSTKGVESNPSPETAFTLAAGGPYTQIGIKFWPSDDTQVDQVRVYSTVTNGGTAHLIKTVFKETREWDLTSIDTDAVIAAGQELSFDNGEAPTAKFIFLTLDRAFMANTRDLPTGFFPSVSGDTEAFPADNVVRLDAPEADPISGISGAYGRIYVHEKTGLFLVTPSVLFEDFSIQLTQADQGSIGGHALVNISGADYFRGERGILAFSGTDHEEISQRIESTYRGRLDDLENFPGFNFSQVENSYAVNWKRGNEIWFTGRRAGDSRNDRILVVNRAIQGQPWSLYVGLEYTAVIEAEDLDGTSSLYGTTYTGHVFKLEEGRIDGESAIRLTDGTTSPVTGTVDAGPTNTVIPSGVTTLHTYDDGYKGRFLTIVRRDATTQKILFSDRQRILSSTSSAFTLENAITGFIVAQGDTWFVGGIESYFTTGWLDAGAGIYDKDWKYFDASFKPVTNGNFDFYFITTNQNPDVLSDLFSRTASQYKRVPMGPGFTTWEPLEDAGWGRYFRCQIYTISVGGTTEFDIFELTLRPDVASVGGGPSSGT